jgi:hypothetical protein
MAIGGGDFTVDARRGWAFYFNVADPAFANWEAPMKVYLEAQGIKYNRQRLESQQGRREKIEQIRQSLRGATEEQIVAVLTALGLS